MARTTTGQPPTPCRPLRCSVPSGRKPPHPDGIRATHRNLDYSTRPILPPCPVIQIPPKLGFVPRAFSHPHPWHQGSEPRASGPTTPCPPLRCSSPPCRQPAHLEGIRTTHRSQENSTRPRLPRALFSRHLRSQARPSRRQRAKVTQFHYHPGLHQPVSVLESSFTLPRACWNPPQSPTEYTRYHKY
jgi:hypothetical protein